MQKTNPSRPLALVTGASGFVGRHLLHELQQTTTWDLMSLTRRMSQAIPGVRNVVCDLLDADLLQRTLEHHQPTHIIHLAAQSYVPSSLNDPRTTLRTNVEGLLNLLESARTLTTDPLVLVVGSAEQYGLVEPGSLPITESTPFRPASPYAVSKITQDMLALQYWLTWGLRTIRVRPFNHVGPGQSDRFMLASFARQVAEVEYGVADPVILTGNLEARRDLLDVRDVVRAYRLLLEHGTPGEVYNLASGVARRIGDLLDALIGLSRVTLDVRQDPARMRPADIPELRGDATRLRNAVGWKPEIPISQTVIDTLDWWRVQVQGNGGVNSRP